MYEKAEKRLDDFYEKYDNFYTPIQKDQDWYNENVIGKFRKGIDELYARGEDPLRTASGRAKLAQLARSIDVGTVNKLRSSRDYANEYIKAAGALDASGKYNPELERYLGRDLSSWDTAGSGKVWQFSSPTENKSIDDIIEPVIKNLEYSYDEARTKQANDGNDYYTVTEDRIRSTIDDAMPDLMQNNTIGGYYYNQALQQTGDPEAAKQLYTQWLVDRGRDHLKERFTPNEFKKLEREFQYKKQLENMRYQHDMNVAAIKAAGKEGGGDPRYSATMNMVVDSEGALRGQLMTYVNNTKAIESLDKEDKLVNAEIRKLYEQDPIKNRDLINNLALQQINKRNAIGLEGVADQVNGIANKTSGIFGGTYFTDTPEKLNTILRDLSSQASMTTASNLLKQFGTPTGDGGVVLGAHRNRMTGVGEVMEDVLTRGYNDGKQHKSIDNALKHLKSGNLAKYRPSWTAGNFDIRNEVDDDTWWTSGNKEFWPTGNVVSGDKYYYVEISNSPTDHDECCWFKVERDKVKGGGINPVISSLTQEVDDAFMKQYSSSNVIGNQQSAV